MGERRTSGTRDITYDLVSVIYHALQGAETYGVYIQDAEEEGDQELATFFREVQQHNRDAAERAKGLLANRLGQSGNR